MIAANSAQGFLQAVAKSAGLLKKAARRWKILRILFGLTWNFLHFLLRLFDRFSFDAICSFGYLIRKYRRPRALESGRNLKVLHVTCSFDLGGTQRQIMNLCESSKGSRKFIHETTELFPEDNFLFRKGAHLVRELYTSGGFFSRILGEIVMLAPYRSLYFLQIYKLVCDFRAIRPDFVVGWGHEIALTSFVAASIARVPRTVFCIRTFNPSYYGLTRMYTLLKRAHKRIIPFLDGIIVNSTILQEDYSRWLGISKEGINVCPNGIDPQSLSDDNKRRYRKEIRESLGIPDSAIVVINVGRFSEEKGQMMLASAFKAVQESRGTLYCLFCGDGPTKGKVEDYVSGNKVPNALFVGRVQDAPRYLCASDIFVMPSNIEGMPNAMMEAMTYGLPCISTNLTGALDIAREGVEALYADVGSVKQLAEKLSYLIDRPEERRRLGQNARSRIKYFSIAEMIRTFERQLELFAVGR
ncbi:MAG: glycosyltransferase [Armatimonadetes bacterium]|nr:glycosyltransferase [Armatimonadota bacterium]